MTKKNDVKPQLVHLGAVSFPTKKVIVSDPCYDSSVWCKGDLEVSQVDWHAWVFRFSCDEWGVRNGQLILTSTEEPPSLSRRSWGKDTGIDVGVDSGQAGFFDSDHYKKDEDSDGTNPIHPVFGTPISDESWYAMCCGRTLEKGVGAGTIPFGVVSSSGYGDGGYKCFKHRRKDGRETIRIVFIGNDSYTEKWIKQWSGDATKEKVGK